MKEEEIKYLHICDRYKINGECSPECPEYDKLFCQGVKDSTRQQRKDSRDRNVKGTLTLLKKCNLKYSETKTPNIVTINHKNKKVFISLKKLDRILIKCRFEGNNKWYTYTRTKFAEEFKRKDI